MKPSQRKKLKMAIRIMEEGNIRREIWVHTPDGIGLVLGVGREVHVHVGSAVKAYATNEIRPCTMSSFMFSRHGFGLAPWGMSAVILGAPVAAAVAMLLDGGGMRWLIAGLVLLPAVVFIAGTMAQFKRWWL